MPYADPLRAKEFRRQRYLQHRDKYLANAKRRYSEKREECLQRQREYAQLPSFVDRRRVRWAKWYRDRRSERIAYTREWRANNPDKAKLTKLLARINRRAREKGAKGSFTKDQWLQKLAYHGWRCIYCRCELTLRTVTVEHRKELSKGGSNWPANLAPACRSCNASRIGKKGVTHAQ